MEPKGQAILGITTAAGRTHLISVMPLSWQRPAPEGATEEEKWQAACRGHWRFQQAQRARQGLPMISYETWYDQEIEPLDEAVPGEGSGDGPRGGDEGVPDPQELVEFIARAYGERLHD